MKSEVTPSVPNLTFVYLAGAEAALCVTTLLTANYATFVPVIFPVATSAVVLFWPVLILLRICAAFHLFTGALLILSVFVNLFKTGPFAIPENGKTLTLLIILIQPCLGVTALYVGSRLKSEWKGKVDSPKTLEAVVGLELPSSLDITPRSTERVSSATRGPLTKSPIYDGQQPFATLLSQPMGLGKARSSFGMSPVKNPVSEKPGEGPCLVLYSPYSSPSAPEKSEAACISIREI